MQTFMFTPSRSTISTPDIQVRRVGRAKRGRERLEQFHRRRVADQGLPENPFECLLEEIDEGLASGEAILDSRPRDIEAEPGSGAVEVCPGGVGFLEESDDDHEKEGPACELACTDDDLALASDFVEFVAQLFLQRSRDGPYDIHQGAPSSHSC